MTGDDDKIFISERFILVVVENDDGNNDFDVVVTVDVCVSIK